MTSNTTGVVLAGLELLLIDGYVYLSNDKRPGLGWHVGRQKGTFWFSVRAFANRKE